MALTIAGVRKTVEGNRQVKVFDVTFDSSYVTGGEALTVADMGLRSLDEFSAEPDVNGNYVVYDRTNAKLLLFDIDSQAANAFNASAVVIRCRAVGRGG
jgi:hypothetical protein